MRILHKSKRALAPLPQVAELIDRLLATEDNDLHEVLGQIDSWRWPRSDLNAWIQVLNKFDTILEEVIRDYDIDNLQVNVLTPLTKKTVCEILRFERLLLENSTNRKTFNSYDRLNSLMLTSDLDILILVLNLLLRPAQQYSAQAAVLSALSISTARLTSLAKRWPNLREYDINLIDLVGDKGKAQIEALPNEAREVNFTFYRQESPNQEKEKPTEGDVFDSPSGRKPGASSSGAVTIHIDSTTIESKEPMDILADTMETYAFPESEKFELLTRIRDARVLGKSHSSEREKLVIIRLLATAIFGHTHIESQAQSALLLYEPDLIMHIAELLQLDRGVDVQVQTAAIAALDALGRYKTKNQDVLTAVNAGVNHGVLMALLRKTVADVAQPTSTLPQAFVEGLLSFVTFVATHASGGNMIVGAGLVPLLIQVIENRLPNRLYVVSKTMQLVDNVLYGFNNAFQLFCNGRGVEILVDRIEYEVELDLAQCATEQPSREVVVSYGRLSVARAAVLKHTMRSMHRMMQSPGTAEGLRGLLDSSLLKSVKKIMENRSVFGPSVLPIAINIMATFVHNEPTCLPVIQETGLPEAFYSVVESGLEPVIEVIQSVPNAMGALCLNQAGQDQLVARPTIVPGLFAIFTSERHQRVLQDKENSVLIGTVIEELIRHHPLLKDSVFASIRATMDKIEVLGKAYVPPEDIKHWYRLLPTASSSSASNQMSADGDVVMEPIEDDKQEETTTAAADADTTTANDSPRELSSLRSHDNTVISFIDVFSKFLEGFFQHVPHCKDFIGDADTIDRFGRLTALPCLPYDFANSVASDSLVQVVRTMAEAATAETIAFLIKLVNESLGETKEFWETMDEHSRLLSMVEVSGEDADKANVRFRKLITLHVRVSLLSDIYTTAGYSHGRAILVLLQSLTGRPSPAVLLDLGALHRAFVWENIVLKAGLASQGLSGASSSAALTSVGSETASTVTPVGTPGIASQETSTLSANGVNGIQGDGVAAPTKQESSKNDGPKEQNAKATKHLVGQIPSALAPFFQAVVRLFQTRRSTDALQRTKIRETATILADVVAKHLEEQAFDDRLSVFAHYTVMLGLTTILLIDERTSQKTIQTVLLVAFYRIGGLDKIYTLCRRFMETIETVSLVNMDDRSDIAKQELVHAYGGLKVALHLLHPIVSANALFGSTQTNIATTTDKKDTDPDYFEHHNFLVKMRASTLPLLREVWTASWLVASPLSVSKSVVVIVMELLNVDGEEVKPAAAPGTAAVTPGGLSITRPAPDETRIRQLCDMGFPRSAAERALTRTRNNVNAATELLLAHPYPFPPDPPEPEAEQNEVADPPPEPQAPAEDAAVNVGEVADGEAEVVVPVVQTAAEETGPASPVPPVAQASEEPVPASKGPQEWLDELNAAREPLKDGIGRQALRLVDEHPSLAFDVQRVFVGPENDYRKQAVQDVVDDIKVFSQSAYDVQEQPLAVRCRLLALVLNDPSSPLSQLSESEAKNLLDVLLALLLSNPDSREGSYSHLTVPKWLGAHLLVVEALLTIGDEPRKISLPQSEDDPIVQEPITNGRRYPEARAILFDFCVRLLAMPTLPKDELISSLRLFSLLTQDHAIAAEFVRRDGVGMLFRYLKTSLGTPSATGTQSYITFILRHIVEDASTVDHIMRQEIRRYFSQPRTRVVDVPAYVQACHALALRDPTIFVQITQDICQLSQPFSSLRTITLKAGLEGVVHKPDHAEDKDGSMQVDESPLQNARPSSDTLEALIHFLLAELIKTVKAGHPSEGLTSGQPRPGDPAVPGESKVEPPSTSSNDAAIGPDTDQYDAHAYSCFLMQCLTELLFSYESCKLAFLSYSPRKRVQTPAKEAGLKHRTAAIQFLLSDLMAFGTINPQPSVEAKKHIILCNWAMSVIVALCVDTTPAQDNKEVPPDLVSVRKFVLEAISRALKDIPTSESLESRYSRLLALADLCHRLLTVRFNTSSRKSHEDTPTHIAKVMLEKNFVATLTNALAEVDLNYPNIRGVVTSILRPLDFLSKIAIKMSRVSEKPKDILDDKVEVAPSALSDEEDDAAEHDGDETPDLYRNSSLGIYGGEMEDVHYGPEDDIDEDAEEDEDDVEMDFGDETGSEDTSNTEDDVEDDLEDDLEHATGGSEEGWHDEDEEDEEDLVENDGGDEDDDDEGDEDEEDEGEVMWQDIAVDGDGVGNAAEEPDDEEEAGDNVPIMHMDVDEGENASEDEYGDADQDPSAANVFEIATGFAHVLSDGTMNANERDGQPMFWAGSMRPGRRRGMVDDDLEIFGRPRNATASAPENIVHPLLVDPATTPTRAPASQSRSARRFQRGLVSSTQTHDILQTLEEFMGEGAAQFFQHIVAQGHGAGETIHIDVPSGALAPLQRHGRGHISASIRLERAPRGTEGRSEGRTFEPLVTLQRWTEEVKMLHGRFDIGRIGKLNNHVILALLPAAIVSLRKARKAEEEESVRRREAEVKAEEEAAKEAAEKARLEEEERMQQEHAQALLDEGSQARTDAPLAEAVDRDTEMEDVSNSSAPPDDGQDLEAPSDTVNPIVPEAAVDEAPVAEASTSNVAERITVMIHGNLVDITDTDIDPTFLEALPDDMREEVLNQHVRNQRAARVERPADSQISDEFLDALPPDIRAEILQQESMERARQRVQHPPGQQANAAVPAEIDPASFIASLDPQLRQVVLMDSDDVFIQSLPSHMVAEAGIHRDNARLPNIHPVARNDPHPAASAQSGQKASSRDAIQLLDKPSIAVLARLLFFPHVLKKKLLHKVLLNLCENTKTRIDLFNLLLNILQDGSGDLSAIDKSFAQMSFRSSKQTTQQTPKAIGKQRMPSDYFGTFTSAQATTNSLPYFSSPSTSCLLDFVGLYPRRGRARKSKPHKPTTPVVLLLSLLDRQPVLRTPSVVESVVALLATITRPLASLANLKDTKKEQIDTAGSTSAVLSAPGSAAQLVVPSSVTPSPLTSTEQPAPPASSTATQSAEPAAPTHEAAQDQTTAKSTDEKVLLASPPVIPHTVLRSVVNILTAGECSGRTFSLSLALIQHLSYIPDARDVVANELRSRAQEFGQSLFTALDQLAAALHEAQGEVLSSAIAAQFSPASSDQAKLLRVLKTIDYMYSPKPTTSPPSTASDADVEKVQGIYEAFRFASLWQRLGDCLAIIEENPEIEHIATVLLPLIESLMVVCKYVGPKSSSGATARILRASVSPRSPATTRETMEDLFVTFTDAHRKVLNLMVRNNPSLMSGSFSLLVNNPRVLDFDNKRNYFSQQVHRRPHSREHHGTLQLNVRRQRVFEDSFQYLQRKTGDQIKYGKLSVRFYDEEGVDAGGVTREWFQILARQMFDPNYALFQPCAADRLTYQPNKASWVNPEHLSFFKFVGRIIGKAIYDGRLLDAYFARSLYRQLLGKPVDYRDVEWVDPEYYNSLCWILENDPSGLELTFSVEADEFGVTKIIDLKENGASISVTQENKREFVQLSAQYRLYSSIKDQIESLVAGFYEIIPKDLVTIFNEQELELLISGTPDIDVDEWRGATEYSGYTSSDPVVVWWWRALKSFNREERAKVLSFATGTSRVPLGGFVELQGVQGVQRFSIHRAYGDTDRLPQAHTCFNQIDLPQYSSYEMLRQQLLLAINEGGEGFGFA
ncbi:hypothetical protein B0H21DRAFT_198859 [Amylocystis lapponica]|nr:hypothetical protein B0H21DRAFT_198859 [Amylocystis lapponica]